METLVLDGKEFVKASKAARDLGYTADYVGQLCRGGKVTAHLVGRTWYVDMSQLGEHRVTKKRMSRVKAREQAHKAIEEHKKLRVQASDISVGANRVRYEEDASELIPSIRKLEITPEKHTERKPERASREPVEEPFSIENEGKKIVMSGKLQVVDLSDETNIDEDTVVLHSRINRKSYKRETAPEVEKQEEAVTEEEVPADTETAVEIASQPMNFAKRLELLESKPKDEVDRVVETLLGPQTKKKKESYTVYVLFILFMFIITTLSLALDAQWVVQTDKERAGGVYVKSTFGIDIQKAIANISNKI